MTVGIGMIGSEVGFTVGGVELVGISSKGATLNNEPLETTDDQSSGWTELLATPGVKNLEYSISGILKNLELMKTWGNGGSQMFECIVTYKDGSTLTFDGFMNSFSETGESLGLLTFDSTFSSSGAVTFVAGV